MIQFSNKSEEIYFLAVETSCDDTSISVLWAKESGGKLMKIEALSNVVSSQTELHAGYGGVYPFLAKREHQKNLPLVFEQAIKESPEQKRGAVKKIDVSKIKFIGVTKGPGLDPCLWTGIILPRTWPRNADFRWWALIIWRRIFWQIC
jgi:N6-L-threonylcarbamoyladenine synthase